MFIQLCPGRRAPSVYCSVFQIMGGDPSEGREIDLLDRK
jgi:hypothetical protein